MRLLVRLVIVLAVLVAMFLLATELLVKPFAERAVARQIRDDRDLATTPDVDLSGFPFALAVARGRFDGASVDIADYEVEGLKLRTAAIDLDDVTFDIGSLVNGNSDVEAGSATIVAEVTDADLNTWLVARGVPLSVAFTGGAVHVQGELAVEGLTGRLEATGTVGVEAGALTFVPSEVLVGGVAVPAELVELARSAVAFSVPLPQVVGVDVTGATVGEGRASLTADVTDYLMAGTLDGGGS